MERKPLVVSIGASAGGITAIRNLLAEISPDIPAIITIATHRSPGSDEAFHQLLSMYSELKVHWADDGDYLHCARVYIGGSTARFRVAGDTAEVHPDGDRRLRMRRIDELFESNAHSNGADSCGILLSGTMTDGVTGLAAIRSAGGFTAVQSPTDAVRSELLINALTRVDVDYVGTPGEIGRRLSGLASGRAC